jgi:hypothetical protein
MNSLKIEKYFKGKMVLYGILGILVLLLVLYKFGHIIGPQIYYLTN